MRILVVAKATNLELYGELISKRIASGSLPLEYMETLKKAHKEHYQTLDRLTLKLKQKKIEFVSVSRGLYWPDLNKITHVITVGGDGTVLATSQKIKSPDLPLIGLRSSRLSVGHLCAGGLESLDDIIHKLSENKLFSKKIQRHSAHVHVIQSGKILKSDPVVNDFLFANKHPAATSRYAIHFNDKKEEHKSSGIWVCCAAGSSAAISAAGGSAMPLEGTGLQFLVRELFQGKKDTTNQLSNEIFDPDLDSFKIINHCDEAILATDGQHGTISLQYGDTISFKKEKSLSLVKI